jgi:FkbM family methyltransferase
MNIISEYKYGKVIYNSNDYYIGNCISEYGEYCDDEIILLSSLINKNDVVLDIGANIGLMTLPFSKMVGFDGKVISFEPQPEIFRILCGNVAINNMRNVETYNLAVGDSQKVINVPILDYTKPNNFGGIRLSEKNGINVNQIRLDDLSFDKLNLMKIDVETMEINVLNGAYYTIKKHRPILYVENDNREYSPALLDFLLQENYDCYWHISRLFKINNHKNNPINVFESDFICSNVLAIPNERNLSFNLTKINSNTDWFK